MDVNLTFLSVFFIFSKKLKANIRCEFIKEIKESANERNKLVEENASIAARLSKESEFYSAASKYDKGLLEVYRISDKEKEKLTTNINNHIANSLTEIRELIRILVRAHEGNIDIPITHTKQTEILTNIHNKLVYLSEFSVAYQEESVDIAVVICGIIGIYAKNILLNNLSITPKISSKIKTIRFNALLLQQIIVSLLHISVECSRPGGEIKIEAVKKKIKAKESLVISIKDNGFQLTEDYESTLEVNRAISPLKLDLHTIKNLIEMHNGTLEIKYTKEGKTIYLILPFKAPSENDKKTIVEGGNVVLFKNN